MLAKHVAKDPVISEHPHVYFASTPPDRFTLRARYRFMAQEYLSAARDYLEADEDRPPARDIEGVWVASDDPTVVEELRALVPTFFPSVNSDGIVWVGGGVHGGPETTGVATHTKFQVSLITVSLYKYDRWTM